MTIQCIHSSEYDPRRHRVISGPGEDTCSGSCDVSTTPTVTTSAPQYYCVNELPIADINLPFSPNGTYDNNMFRLEIYTSSTLQESDFTNDDGPIPYTVISSDIGTNFNGTLFYSYVLEFTRSDFFVPNVTFNGQSPFTIVSASTEINGQTETNILNNIYTSQDFEDSKLSLGFASDDWQAAQRSFYCYQHKTDVNNKGCSNGSLPTEYYNITGGPFDSFTECQKCGFQIGTTEPGTTEPGTTPPPNAVCAGLVPKFGTSRFYGINGEESICSYNGDYYYSSSPNFSCYADSHCNKYNNDKSLYGEKKLFDIESTTFEPVYIDGKAVYYNIKWDASLYCWIKVELTSGSNEARSYKITAECNLNLGPFGFAKQSIDFETTANECSSFLKFVSVDFLDRQICTADEEGTYSCNMTTDRALIEISWHDPLTGQSSSYSEVVTPSVEVGVPGNIPAAHVTALYQSMRKHPCMSYFLNPGWNIFSLDPCTSCVAKIGRQVLELSIGR